jgi:uncharacterized membrane protein YgcG
MMSSDYQTEPSAVDERGKIDREAHREAWNLTGAEMDELESNIAKPMTAAEVYNDILNIPGRRTVTVYVGLRTADKNEHGFRVIMVDKEIVHYASDHDDRANKSMTLKTLRARIRSLGERGGIAGSVTVRRLMDTYDFSGAAPVREMHFVNFQRTEGYTFSGQPNPCLFFRNPSKIPRLSYDKTATPDDEPVAYLESRRMKVVRPAELESVLPFLTAAPRPRFSMRSLLSVCTGVDERVTPHTKFCEIRMGWHEEKHGTLERTARCRLIITPVPDAEYDAFMRRLKEFDLRVYQQMRVPLPRGRADGWIMSRTVDRIAISYCNCCEELCFEIPDEPPEMPNAILSVGSMGRFRFYVINPDYLEDLPPRQQGGGGRGRGRGRGRGGAQGGGGGARGGAQGGGRGRGGAQGAGGRITEIDD